MNVEKPTKPATQDKPRTFTAVDASLLALLSVTAVVLRWPQMHESLWVDELHTAWAISGGLGELPSRCAIGNQSPVWFLLPLLSVQLLGLSEFAVRLPSLLAGVALAPAAYWLTRQLSASRIGACVAAAIVVFDENCLTFATEARPYAWVQLAGLLQVAAFWNCLRASGWKARVAFVGTSALLFHLHYTAILLLAGECVFFATALFAWRDEFKYSVRQFAVDVLGVAVLCLHSLPRLLEIAARRENWATFISVPSEWGDWLMFPFPAYLVAPLLMVYGWVLWVKIRGVDRPITAVAQELPPLLLAACWLLAPLTIAWALTQSDIAALWMGRYVIVCAAALPVLAGLLVSLPTSGGARLGIGAGTLLVAMVFAGPSWSMWWQTGYWTGWSGEDWKSAVAHVNAQERTSDWPILIRPDLIEADGLAESSDGLLREYCLLPIRSIYAVGEDRVAIPLASSKPGVIAAADMDRLRGAQGVWIVNRGRREYSELTFKSVLRTLAREGMVARNKNTQTFGRVWVMQVEIADRP